MLTLVRGMNNHNYLFLFSSLSVFTHIQYDSVDNLDVKNIILFFMIKLSFLGFFVCLFCFVLFSLPSEVVINHRESPARAVISPGE